MSTPSDQLLRRLLPRYFWLRDAVDGGGVLDALVSGLAAQHAALRMEVELLYDQFFIATCDPEYVPLIGDNIGVVGLTPVAGPGVGDRAWVGRVIGLRRRKGSLGTVARGVTAASGWAVYAQEGRGVTSATASVRHPSTDTPGFVNVSGRAAGATPAQPWSPAGVTASVAGRPIAAGTMAGWTAGGAPAAPSPSAVSVHIWRMTSFPVTGRAASPAGDAPERLSGRAFRFDPLGRDIRLFATPQPPADRTLPPQPSELPLPLTADLLAEAQASGSAAVQAVVSGRGLALAPGDLHGWRPRRGERRVDGYVDPLTGRLLLNNPATGPVQVSYAYGFPGELGGGPYGTDDDYAPLPSGTPERQVAQSGGRGVSETVEAALARVGQQGASIVVEDSGTYTAPHSGWELTVPPGARVRIASAPEAAPVLIGDIRARVEPLARLELSGLTIAGTLTVTGTGEVALEHCTLAPESGRESLRTSPDVAMSLSFVITGAIAAGDAAVTSTIVDGSITCAHSLNAEYVTVLGPTQAPTIDAGDSIFAAELRGDRGLVRTSYLADGAGSLQSAGCTGPRSGTVRFSSTRWGDSDYCQLRLDGPASVAAGGSLGSEMGAFHWLGQPARLARVPVILQELLPAGIGANLTYVN